MVKLWTPALGLAALLSTVAGVASPAAPLNPTSPAAGAAILPLGQTQVAGIPPRNPAANTPIVIQPVAPSPAVTKPAPAPVTPPVPSPAASTPAATAPGQTTAQGKGTNPLVIKGYRFFDSVTGKYFAMRGVNYYPRPNTGLLDANNLDLFTKQYRHIWGRDVPHFAAVGANAIRLYAVDPDGDHTDFMCALQSAGIYVIVDLGSSCKGCEITPDAPPACYPASYKTRGEKIIQNFSKYDNVIAFSGGNEVNHRTGGNPSDWNSPCQKKFVRDMRAYIQGCPNMRKIPVGLVVADTDREFHAKYYNCRTDPTDELENAEWYGINVYVHCGDSTDPKVGSGFDTLKKSFEDYKYSIPTILTEFGCTSETFPTVNGYGGQRTFHDAKWMNEPRYSEFFNGGFAFEYSTENANSKSTVPYPFKTAGPQNYGLGYLSPENCDDVSVKCNYVRFPNYDFLAQAYNSTDTSKEPTLTTFKPASDRTKRTECPAKSHKLKEYSWAGDKQKCSECPQIKRYQCPAVPLGAAKISFQEEAPAVAGSNAFTPIADEDKSAGDSANKTISASSVATTSLAAALSSAVILALVL